MAAKKDDVRFLTVTFLSSSLIVAGSYGWFTKKVNFDFSTQNSRIFANLAVPLSHVKPANLHSKNSIYSSPKIEKMPLVRRSPLPSPISAPITKTSSANSPKKQSVVVNPSPSPIVSSSPHLENSPKPTLKQLRGIYLSRYQITNNIDEQSIRERVRYYHSQGINTLIQGVWGNGCTMYKSEVMQQTFGISSCPNEFQPQWLDWMIDEAHKQGMQVHAYFEKGIKIDKNSPIYELAIARQWLLSGVDKTYTRIDHRVLDVAVPEVGDLFKNIVAEFVHKYPEIDAVQWDDYLGYYAELSGKMNRTSQLTSFVQNMVEAVKKVNAKVSFDICHHNPYWAKRYFSADLLSWKVDRIFIQAYNEKNFKEELRYSQQYDGIAITDQEMARIPEILKTPRINGIFIFPLTINPQQTAANFKQATEIAIAPLSTKNR